MDICRCEKYAEAVKNLKFYTVGCLRPEIIENYDRTGYATIWVQNSMTQEDRRVARPRGIAIEEHSPQPKLPKEARKIERMWCPFMTPCVVKPLKTV